MWKPFTSAFRLGCLLGLAAFFLALPLHAQPDRWVPTNWAGVKARVDLVQRLPGNRVAIRLFYQAGQDAPEQTVICGEVRTYHSKNEFTGEEIVEEIPDAYSIEAATLVETATGVRFSRSPKQPGDPFPGPSSLINMLRPREGFRMGVILNAPPPGDKEAEIELEIPGLKRPLKAKLPIREGPDQNSRRSAGNS